MEHKSTRTEGSMIDDPKFQEGPISLRIKKMRTGRVLVKGYFRWAPDAQILAKTKSIKQAHKFIRELIAFEKQFSQGGSH